MSLKEDISNMITNETKKNIKHLSNISLNSYDLSKMLGAKRNTISHYCNVLVNNGSAIKINTRPVIFLDKKILEDEYKISFSEEYNSIDNLKKYITIKLKKNDFNQVIGYDSSLYGAIKQLKMAAKYPGRGLPVLMTGPTGTGKTFLAKKYYEYSLAHGYISGDFVQLNCAEYADNPELLTSILFGYKKSSFTGALNDKKGLFDKAENGVLFLDEIHQLSPKGQEKLFEYLDHNHITPLGSTNSHIVNVRLICATTENAQGSFLLTFLRRIPIQIDIPILKERTEKEKEQLIFYFFKSQQKKLNMPIFVNNEVINYLLIQDYSSNVGQLKNVITLTVAKSLERVDEATKCLKISIIDLPEKLLLMSKNSNQLLMKTDQKLISISNIDVFSLGNSNNIVHEMFKSIKKLYKYNHNKNMDFIDSLLSEFSILRHKLVFDSSIKTGGISIEYIQKIVDSIVKKNKNIFQIDTANNLNMVLSYYIYELQYENINYSRCEEKLLKRLCELLDKSNNEINDFIEALITDLKKNLGFSGGLMDYLFLQSYFISCSYNINEKSVRCILLAHGYSVASSIADTVNEIIGKHIIDSINMPFDVSTRRVGEHLTQYIQKNKIYDGLIVLVDMGSLEGITKYITCRIDFPIGIINNVSTQLALYVATNIAKEKPLTEIVENTGENITISNKIVYPREKKKNIIITCCLTGIGTANQIKKLLTKAINSTDNINIYSLSFNKLKKPKEINDLQQMFNILAIVGTANPQIKKIPYFALEDIISGSRLSEFSKIINKFEENTLKGDFNGRIIKLFSLNRVVSSLTILDAEKVMKVIDVLILKIKRNLNINITNQVQMALYVHVSCLIERLIRKVPISSYNFSKNENKDIRDTDTFLALKRCFSVIEKNYSVKVPDSELGYVLDILVERFS